jgi:hypothetical protein
MGRSGPWPFWVLLAAWFFANSPQEATFELIVWSGGARHFSHQELLRQEVARLLAGKPGPIAWHATKLPDAPRQPVAPPETASRKIDLYVSIAAEPAEPADRVLTHPERSDREPGRWRSEPLLGPPRA